MLSPTEFELIKMHNSVLINILAFINNRDNDKILEELNNKGKAIFTDDNAVRFHVFKEDIQDLINFSNFVINAENGARISK